MTTGLFWKLFLASSLFFVPVMRSLGADDAPKAFREAYYLETHEDNLAAAADLYEKVAGDKRTSQAIRVEALTRLAGCREDLRAADLASLMPPDAILFAELHNPGEHLGQLASMLDVVGDPLANIGGEAYPVPGEDGFVIPKRILLSPALLEQAKSFEGVAVAFTDFQDDGETPKGVLVLHPGDSDALRGLLETGAQFAKAAEPIMGFPAIEIRDVDTHATVAFTARLVIAGTDRALVEDVIGRLRGDLTDSLATAPAFTADTARREDTMLYAFVNVKKALEFAFRHSQDHPEIRGELFQVQAFFDIAHINSLSVAIGVADNALQGEVVLSLAEEQTSLIYNLMRTPPMKGRVLGLVPAEAAAVFAIGINPDGSAAGAQTMTTKVQSVQAVTGLDLGRELFANIREVAVFLLPPADGQVGPLPDVGLVFAVGDPAKSEALWSYLLGLPAQAAGMGEQSPRVSTIAGVEVQAFSVDDGVSVHLARTNNSILVGLTQAAIEAMIATERSGHGLLDEPAMKPATAQIGPDTSIALIAHLGRLATVAGAHASAHEKPIFSALSRAGSHTMATVFIDESQTRMRAAGKLAGLPRAADIIDALAKVGMFSDQGDPAKENDKLVSSGSEQLMPQE